MLQNLQRGLGAITIGAVCMVACGETPTLTSGILVAHGARDAQLARYSGLRDLRLT